jgi:hypothetical protein
MKNFSRQSQQLLTVAPAAKPGNTTAVSHLAVSSMAQSSTVGAQWTKNGHETMRCDTTVLLYSILLMIRHFPFFNSCLPLNGSFTPAYRSYQLWNQHAA